MDNLATAVRVYCARRDISQAHLAAELGISRQRLSGYLTGREGSRTIAGLLRPLRLRPAPCTRCGWVPCRCNGGGP
jgi:transcriptional regulator with XRE-family HTH domain